MVNQAGAAGPPIVPQQPMSVQNKRAAFHYTILTSAVLIAGAAVFVALMATNNASFGKTFDSLAGRITFVATAAVTVAGATMAVISAFDHFSSVRQQKAQEADKAKAAAAEAKAAAAVEAEKMKSKLITDKEKITKQIKDYFGEENDLYKTWESRNENQSDFNSSMQKKWPEGSNSDHIKVMIKNYYKLFNKLNKP